MRMSIFYVQPIRFNSVASCEFIKIYKKKKKEFKEKGNKWHSFEWRKNHNKKEQKRCVSY